MRPQTLEEAWELNQKRRNCIVAGMMWLKMSRRSLSTAIDLCDLGLDSIEETEDEFRDLIDFMDTVGFDYTSVFAYSQEEGSLAAKMEGQVDEEVKLERAQEAMDLAESLGFAATAAHVGERAQVIVDGIEETEDGAELIGHAWFQAPDSDGAVHLDASEASVGDILTVEFTDSFCYELIGHVVE